MIAFARKNLSCLFSNPNSFLCNSNVLSIHLFSTSMVKRLIIPCPEICDVLVNKHQFSSELASLTASRLPKFGGPESADTVLSFLKENSFTTTQQQKLVKDIPRILGFRIESLKSRFKLFQDLGLSSEEIAKIISMSPSILYLNMEKKIIPRISVLKSLLGSNHDVARLLRNSAWFVVSDLEKTLMPNVEILKSCSIPMERILHFLHLRPRCFLAKSDILRKSVYRAIEFEVSQTSVAFIQAVSVFAFTSQGMWEDKLQSLRDLGFSDDDIFTMFRKHPLAFSLSAKKMKNVIELLLATGKYSISSIVSSPSSVAYSIEKRLEPRLQILGALESRNLIEKWPSLGTLTHWNNDRFFDRFIRPYFDGIGKEQIIRYMSMVKRDEAL